VGEPTPGQRDVAEGDIVFRFGGTIELPLLQLADDIESLGASMDRVFFLNPQGS
jgi:hypothetical protein